MSVLIIQIPLRPREAAQRASRSTGPDATPREWTYVFSPDGQTVTRQGIAAPIQMPAADRVVAVVHEDDVSWMQAPVAKLPAARLREGLIGALEDDWLDDPQDLHLALQASSTASAARATSTNQAAASGAQTSELRWVAVMAKGWLKAELAALREGGLEADAVMALAEPGPTVRLHAREGRRAAGELVCAGPWGVAILPLDWSGLTARLQQWRLDEARWTSEPAAAARLAAQFKQHATLLNRDERLLRAAAVGSNLLQFELTPRRRGMRLLAAAIAEFKTPRWRATRWGLVSLALVQVLGLNAWAWQQSQQILSLQAQMEQVLKQSFPQTRTIVDAPLQMEREFQALLQASGQPGPQELESLIDMVARAWPAQGPAADNIRMDSQGLHITAAALGEHLEQQLRSEAASIGWSLRREGSTLSLLRPQGVRP